MVCKLTILRFNQESRNAGRIHPPVLLDSLLPRFKTGRQAGFTLAESLVGMAIGLLVLAAGIVLWGFASQSFAAVFNFVDLADNSKRTLDHLSQQIRNAKSVVSCGATNLTLLDPDDNQVQFYFSNASKRLIKSIGGTNTTLLTGCDSLQFSVFQRPSVTNVYDAFPAASATNTAKLVQIQWTCSRQLTGSRQNAEEQISAKVVVRNQ